MTDRPWKQFFIADHVAETMHLSTLEHGAYMLLLLHYWRSKELPVCEIDLRRITRLSAAQWRKARQKLLAFFSQDGDAYRSAKFDAEIKRADTQIEAKTQRAKAAAAARWHTPGNAFASIEQPITQTESESVPESESEKERHMSDKSDLSVPKLKSVRKTYPESFEAFWRDYPTDALMSKVKAFEKWQRLSPEDHAAAQAALAGFKAYCTKNPTYRPVHAERFLSQRRFDGFGNSPGNKPDTELARILDEERQNLARMGLQ